MWQCKYPGIVQNKINARSLQGITYTVSVKSLKSAEENSKQSVIMGGKLSSIDGKLDQLQHLEKIACVLEKIGEKGGLI